MIRIVLGILSAFALLGGGYVLQQQSAERYVAPDNMTPPPSVEGITDALEAKRVLTEIPILTDRKVNEKKEGTELYVIDIVHPNIVLATTPDIARQANDVIESFIRRTKDEFMESVRETNKNAELPKGIFSTVTVRYQPTLVTPNIITIRFDIASYMRGAAHPNNESRILTYHLAEKALLEAHDLFMPGKDYLDRLSTRARNELRAKFRTPVGKELDTDAIVGTQPSNDNFSVLALRHDGLQVIFNPYQVGAYALGTIEFTIPYSELMDVLAESVRHEVAALQKVDAVSTTTGQMEM